MELAGIVLAGGAARRLSGVDKPMLEVGGTPLLRRAVDALGAARPVVVVGPRRPGLPGVRWTREDPPGGGPVAALAAGLAALSPGYPEVVAVLAADLTGVQSSTVDKLVRALGKADGAVLVDPEGRWQWLIGAWRTTKLRAVLPPEPSGASLRKVLGGLSIVAVPGAPGESADVDTPTDLDRLTGRPPVVN
ncbi:MAG TPA: NTP transferase domain-containing protein [Amycolatopsis sp.]|uniref:molybdenum cofactor guanylyltransferase n=1 Tax=Amycolatopsis sp. TaxID=37632 RepID=UPI002B471A65|nr:NTP transferase domain-containing protein [Amycolatopsis sp.]HKS49100.1 NTP transferase domain-containing protein [Amycolatopsis sp.]